jgi:hypothetical protein
MLFGHSQGAMQAVKVLDKLAGVSAKQLHVWNPLTWEKEDACEITDPLTHERRPVVGLQLSYASVVGGGGLTRILPNQWDMFFKLREIPNSVEEFTGFCKTKDLLGGDFLGYGSINEYKPMDKAVVRNVWLPSSYKHGEIPDTRHLLQSRQVMDWINNYQPSDKPVDRPKSDAKLEGNTGHILWAAEVWYCVKKHWVLELQRLIRAGNLQGPQNNTAARPFRGASGCGSVEFSPGLAGVTSATKFVPGALLHRPNARARKIDR